MTERPAEPDDDWLALALVAAFTTFLRVARKRLGLKHGETCPRCQCKFALIAALLASGLTVVA